MRLWSSFVSGVKKTATAIKETYHEIKEKARDICDRVSTRIEEWNRVGGKC